MANLHFFFSLSLLAVVTLTVTINGIHAINVYDFVNRAGSSAGYVRFNREIGVSYARQTLITATYDIWRLFEQYSSAQKKDLNRLVLILENFPDSDAHVPAYAATLMSRLDYCTAFRSNFVGELNKKMRPTGYTDDYFRQLLGRTIYQLWDGYKSTYPG